MQHHHAAALRQNRLDTWYFEYMACQLMQHNIGASIEIILSCHSLTSRVIAMDCVVG